MLDKPFFIVEGYDASRVAPKFKKPLDWRAILKILRDQTRPYDFTFSLDDIAGYDLVFLDFNDGTDDILRNVLVFEQALKWINDEKAKAANPQQTVILGMSMGGLVARYGLADITKNGSPSTWPKGTDTRLLISHDSPHQGANTPLGSQYLTRFLASGGTIAGLKLGDMEKMKQGNKLLDEPATEQLSIMKAITYNTFMRNTFLNNVYRPMITFSPSDPTPSYKFIATASGSECGVQIFAPGTTLLSVNSAPLFYRPYIFRPPLLSFSVNIKSLPHQSAGAQNILSINTWASIRMFYSLINMNVLIQNVNSLSPAGELPWDGMPGGTREVRNEIDGENIDVFPFTTAIPISMGLGWVQGLSYSAVEDFCFVPITSSLDITTVNYDALTAKYVGGISPNNPSRAANFIAQEGPFTPQGGGTAVYNNGHRFYTARNARWIFNEMEGIVPNDVNCSSACQPSGLEVSGAGILCNNPESYSIPNIPPGYTITWSVQPSGIVSLTQANNVATLTKLSNGTVTLTASIPFCNGVIPLAKQITVSTSSGSLSVYSVSDYVSPGMPLPFVALYPDRCSLLNAEWQVSPSDATIEYNQGYTCLLDNNTAVTISFPSYGTYSVRTRVLNICGWSYWSQPKYIQVSYGMYFSVSPNPVSASGTITVQANETKTAAITEVKLFDQLGTMKKQLNYNSGAKQVKVNTSGLKAGVYFIEISNGQTKERQKIIIQN